MRRIAPVALALILSFFLSSCLFSHRVIVRHNKVVTSGATPVLFSATRDELNARIRNFYSAINSFQATVDMTPSVGSVYKGKITDYTDVHAFVLFKKPNLIRIIGQLPVVRTKEFDMVSNGQDFSVYLVSKNLFIEGSNTAPATSKSTLENLRPEAFLSSMLIRPAEPGESLVLEDRTDEDNALYVLHFIRTEPDGTLMLERNVWFDRLDLSIVRQVVFDELGAIISDTRYSKWHEYGKVTFPSHIDINRDKDGYGVGMEILDMKMNVPLTEEQFALPRPEGTTLRRIGETK